MIPIEILSPGGGPTEGWVGLVFYVFVWGNKSGSTPTLELIFTPPVDLAIGVGSCLDFQELSSQY